MKSVTVSPVSRSCFSVLKSQESFSDHNSQFELSRDGQMHRKHLSLVCCVFMNYFVL